MSKWEKVRLGDVIVIDKKQVEVNELDPDSIYIGLEHIEKDSGIITAKPTVSESKIKSSKFRFSTSHILYGKLRPYLNKVARPNFNGVCSTDIYPILVTNKANKNFVYYILRSPSFVNYASTKSSGANLPRINEKDVMEYQFTLPPLDIQKKIAHELDLTSIILDLQRYHLQELNQLIKSVFYEMFGDPLRNEQGWEKKSISEICVINPNKSEMGELNDDTLVTFIPMNSVSDTGELDTSQTREYREVKTGYTYFRDNDVLFAKITPCMENGKGAVARNLCNGIGFGSTEFHVLRPIDNLTDSEWLYRLTSLPTFRAHAEKNMTGSAGQKRVPASFFDKFSIGLPPFSLQQKYTRIVNQIESQNSLVKQSIDETQRLFDSLMSKYFDD